MRELTILMKFLSAVLSLVLFSHPAAAQVRITEFMASNTHTLLDENGDSSDWIELQNTSSNSVSLLNWSLTDSSGNPGKWRFPATNMPPKSFLIVFASGKDRAVAGQELHTNFKLGSEGEYLALLGADGTLATEITPQYPPQFPDVSYGIGMRLTRRFIIGFRPMHPRTPPGRRPISMTRAGKAAPTASGTKRGLLIRRRNRLARKCWRPGRSRIGG